MPAESTHDARDLSGIRGILFDLDGVLTPTLDVHMRAWALLFAPYLAQHGCLPYTDEDYFRYVDGRPRVEGVRALLESRGLLIPLGEPSDAPEADTVWGLGNRKNEEFWRALTEGGIAPYSGSLVFLDEAIEAGFRVGVVSSSRNAVAVLDTAGIHDRFGVIVDGLFAASEGLAGKPHPATYLRGAELLGLPASECAVIEDAESGVRAGRAGDFGLVVGVDRGTGAQALKDAGADLVVDDLDDLRALLPARVREGIGR